MPLVVLCGYPASGKTTRSQQLRDYLAKKHPSKKVITVDDHHDEIKRDSIYSDSHRERESRSNLKSSVQRYLNKDDVVIVDSVNYIKGFRYELYCVTKSCRTPHCVLYCVTDVDTSKKWNSFRKGDQYGDRLLEELIMRFECPSSSNRWDKPLFSVLKHDEIPFEDICCALFENKPPPPNQSTQSQPLSSTNFLYELDKISQDIVAAFMASQKQSVFGDKFSIPECNTHIMLMRTVTLSELQRHRRQFITYTKMHPVEVSKLPSLFMQFLQQSLNN